MTVDPRVAPFAVPTAGVLLAAGAGSRFRADQPATHKLLALYRGRPLLSWAVEHVLAAGFARTFVVTGAVDLTAQLPPEVDVLDNPIWQSGQASSLQRAVTAARDAQLGAIVVGLADQPFVSVATWRAVANSDSPITVATFDGQRRNPVRLASEIWDLLPTNGDEGARVLMRSRPELVREVPCAGNPIDIDTVEDLTSIE